MVTGPNPKPQSWLAAVTHPMRVRTLTLTLTLALTLTLTLTLKP